MDNNFRELYISIIAVIFVTSCSHDSSTTSYFEKDIYINENEFLLPLVEIKTYDIPYVNSKPTTKGYKKDLYSSYTPEQLRAGVQSSCRRDVPNYFKYPHTVKMNWFDGVTVTGTRASGIVAKIPLTAENKWGIPINYMATCRLEPGNDQLRIQID